MYLGKSNMLSRLDKFQSAHHTLDCSIRRYMHSTLGLHRRRMEVQVQPHKHHSMGSRIFRLLVAGTQPSCLFLSHSSGLPSYKFVATLQANVN